MALTIGELDDLVRGGELDTVSIVFPDHFGRLLGKRLTGAFFLETVEKEHWFACNYLLTVDLEMNPLPGFEMASWEKGYGDFALHPDLGTLRRIPWLEKTALVICDVLWESGEPVEQAPRNILRRQCERLAERGQKAFMGSELEFYLFNEPCSELRERGFRDLKPSSDCRIDYHILHSTYDEDMLRAIRNGMCGAGIPVESSKGEWSGGQYEIGLRYAEALEMADRHVLYKNGAKEIAAAKGRAVSFMPKYKVEEAGSGLHIHASLFDTEENANLFWDPEAKGP